MAEMNLNKSSPWNLREKHRPKLCHFQAGAPALEVSRGSCKGFIPSLSTSFPSEKIQTLPIGRIGWSPFNGDHPKDFSRPCLWFGLGTSKGDLVFLSQNLFFSGGNSNMFYVHPENWGKDPHFDEHIFENGLVQPPTSFVLFCLRASHPCISAAKN